MYVGGFGDGTLTIQAGGTVSVEGGGGILGVASNGTYGGTGTLNIGAASGQPAAAVGSLLAAEVAFGAATGRIVFNHTSTAYTFAPKITGAGALLIEAGVTILTGTNTYSGGTNINGGVLSISRDANLGAVSGGLTLNGGTLKTTGSFTSARDVTLGAAGGTIDTSGVLTLSGQISGPGSLFVNGAGTLSLTGAQNVIGGALTLGGSASPTLEIKGGSLTVGDPAGWAMGWNEVSSGLLRVSNGGTLKLVDPMGYLAIKSAMEVSGANSSVTNEGYTDVGGPAAATLTISGGGVMNSKAGALIEGHGTSSTVSVTGAGSVWNVEQHMFIGSKWSNGTGALVVSDGGIVNLNGNLYYDSDAGLGLASATVTVTGAGSQLNVVDGLFVGYGCGCGATTAMLTAADGGTVKAGWVEISDTSVLNLGTGGRAGAIDTRAILNDGAIVADFVDTATLAANISGTGTLTKQGSGRLILTGNSSYTGATSVLSGLLTVNGSLTGSAITLAGGALGGSGTVGSVIVGHAGTVAPGNSIGTLNVAGNISFAPGSTYQLEVNAAGQSDRIAATGTATVSGGTVQLLAEQGGYGASTRYTILTAQGGVIGQFAAVTSNFAFLTPSLAYGATEVALTLDRNAIAFPQVALTRNQAGAAGAAEALGSGNRVYDALLTASVADARAGFDALSGEAHAQAVSVAIEDSHLIRESILNRLRWPLAAGSSGGSVNAAFSADAPGRSAGTTLPAPRLAMERFTLWGEAIGAQGRTDGDRNAASLDR
ncbi:autotransporter-associated beta strand repeat-containing protein, partial [Bosea sp. 2YAB26]|uniref:autotransporter outer membrane beta-barrel domain-containing protein n=1 Tax=Bosea sp. 2YAB26 TaxID=3237478 RepID=UPI003F90A484